MFPHGPLIDPCTYFWLACVPTWTHIGLLAVLAVVPARLLYLLTGSPPLSFAAGLIGLYAGWVFGVAFALWATLTWSVAVPVVWFTWSWLTPRPTDKERIGVGEP